MASLPYGVFSAGDRDPRVGVRIGDSVLDLASALGEQVFAEPSLNAFLAQGRARWSDVRARITELVTEPRHRASVEPALHPLSQVRLHRPFEVGDYVDFFASENHATNVGRLFRPGSEALTPNWKYLPVGYHGRSGTVVLSGTPVIRPRGQRPAGSAPAFGPSRRLDFEAEVGFVVGVGSPLGSPIGVDAFADHVFGVFLVNDWSARDIQAWESQPLGPFLAKSFRTSVSPWIITAEAMEPFCRPQAPRPDGDPQPLQHLYDAADQARGALDIDCEVWLSTPAMRAAGGE